jgi:hypothetical protein
VNFVGFIRPEKFFSGLDQLKAQIKIDCKTAKGLLGDLENEHDRLSPITLDKYLKIFPKLFC